MADEYPWYLPKPGAGFVRGTPTNPAQPKSETDPAVATMMQNADQAAAAYAASKQQVVSNPNTIDRPDDTFGYLPTAAPGTTPDMGSVYQQRLAGAAVPSEAEVQAQEAAKAAAIQQARYAAQNASLRRMGIDTSTTNPVLPDQYNTDIIRGTGKGSAPRAQNVPVELDYSKFGNSRIFGAATGGSKVLNSFTGAGLPSAEAVGGKPVPLSAQISAQLQGVTSEITKLSGSTNFRDLAKMHRLRQVAELLNTQLNVVSQHELGHAQLGERARATRQAERTVGVAQAANVPNVYEALARAQAIMEGPEALTRYTEAQKGMAPYQILPAPMLGATIINRATMGQTYGSIPGIGGQTPYLPSYYGAE